MCDPMTLALMAQAAGGLMGAGGAKQAADQQAQIEENNADVARMQAKDALRRGRLDETALKQAIAQMIGSQRTAYGGGGLQVDSGTPLEVGLDTARTGAIDVATIRTNAALEAWGFRTRAKSLDYQSSITKKGGTQKALGTLLGTVGNMYGTSQA